MTRGIPPDDRRCTAMSKRTRKRCGQASIKGKDKCRFHGGKTPIKHGAYSKYQKTHPDMKKRIDAYLADRDELLNIENSIAVLRAVSSLIMTRLIKKKSSYKDREDIKSMAELLIKTEKETVNAIEKLHRMMYGDTQTIKIENIVTWQNQIVEIINEEVPDESTRNRIASRFQEIGI